MLNSIIVFRALLRAGERLFVIPLSGSFQAELLAVRL